MKYDSRTCLINKSEPSISLKNVMRMHNSCSAAPAMCLAAGPRGSAPTDPAFNYNIFGIVRTSAAPYSVIVKLTADTFCFHVLNNNKGNPTVLCAPTDMDDDVFNALQPLVDKFIQRVVKETRSTEFKKLSVKPEFRDFESSDIELLSIEKLPSSIKHLSDSSILEACTELGFVVQDVVTSSPFAYAGKARDWSALLQNPKVKESFDYDEEFCKNKSIPKALVDVAESVRRNQLDVILLSGGPGVGKSTMARCFAHELGAPYLSLDGDAGTTRNDIFGTWAPNPEYDGLNDTRKYVFNPGPVYKAFTEGYVVCVNELNAIYSENAFVFNAILDGSPTYDFEGVTLKRHPNFVFIATINPGFKGTTEINNALKTRFVNIIIPSLTKEDFISWMRSSDYSNSDYPDAFYGLLYEYQTFVQQFVDDMQENITICPRHAFRFLQFLTLREYNFEEFTEKFVVSYVNSANFDNDNEASINRFISSQEFRDKMTALFDLYPYKGLSEEDNFYDLKSILADAEFSADVSNNPFDEISIIASSTDDVINDMIAALENVNN